jgi:hypothetical protein
MKPKTAAYPKVKVLNFDSRLLYQGYNNDFGPLNIGYLSVYCAEIADYLSQDKIVVHHSTQFPKILSNQVMLMSAYLLLVEQDSLRNVWNNFGGKMENKVDQYRDSGTRYNSFGLTNYDCL